MNIKSKLITIFIITILIFSGIIIFLFKGNNTIQAKDISAPSIDEISGSLTRKAGESATITIKTSDNYGVTSAELYYKPATAIRWSSTSILSGNASISIPSGIIENWYYYVIVDDAAGNGPIGNPSVDGSSYYTITVISNSENKKQNESNNKLFRNNSTIPHAFFEVATKVVCSECPKVSSILDEIFKSEEYPFYYVSLSNTDPKAIQRINQYNILGYPTIYVDGGYRVLIGSKVQKSDLEKAINEALAREKSNISINLKTDLNKETNKLTTTVQITNHDNTTYSGRIRVYLTDMISTSGESNTPERFLFIEFIVDDKVEIKPNEQIQMTKDILIDKLDPENLVIFAALFNSQKQTSYSNPPDKNPFDAYYVDAVSATVVVEDGNIPPEVGITNPKVNYHHLLGKPIRKSIYSNTILLGRTTIAANISDDSGIAKVEFYINEKLTKTVTAPPYEWIWHQFAIGKKTITVKAYDDNGKTSLASIEVFVIMKWENPIIYLLDQILQK